MPAQRDTNCSPVLNTKQLADHLAVDRHTIMDVWVPAGCPVVQAGAKGVAWQFRLADVWRWRTAELDEPDQDGPDFNTESAREKRAKADLAEIARDRLRGRLIEIGDVSAVVQDEYAKVRARLLSLPSALAMAVQHESDLAALERTIKGAVAGALAELAADTREDWAAVAAEHARDGEPEVDNEDGEGE